MPSMSVLSLTPFTGFTDTNQTSYPTANLLINAGYSGPENPGQNGIAVTSISGKGNWIYGFSSSPSGTPIPTSGLSNSNALLLSSSSATAYLNYLISNPSVGYGDTGILTFKGWNKLTGTASTAGAPSFGDTTVGTNFSIQTATLYVEMGISSNSCPILNNFVQIGGGLIHKNSTSDPILISDILSFLGYSKIGVIVTNKSGLCIYSSSGVGVWQYSTDSGGTWVNFGVVTSFRSLLLDSSWSIRYTSAGVNEQASLLWNAWDQSACQPPGGLYCSNVFAGYHTFGSRSTGLGITVSVYGDPAPPPPPPSCVIPISTYTVRDLLTSSLRKLGVVQSGESIPDDDIMDAMECANDVLSSWVLERLMCFHIVNESFSLIPGQNVYTIGKCADLNITTRPVRIERAFLDILTSTPTLTLPIEIINFEQYAEITVKGTPNSIPTKLYYEPTYTSGSPWGTIHLWGVPSVVSRLQLWYWSQISEFTDIDQIIDLPPQYRKALRYATAVEIASEYGVTPSPLVVQIAESSIAKIKRVNQVISVIGVDDAVLGTRRTFNYLTGE